ncbi:VUT family protein [Streptomyces sp. enrichment culture]|uniref:VUT family protein n=1 Tax=Streptomyces sp. enrichment culture TaxID=1795815 RepID=UPI003F56AE81
MTRGIAALTAYALAVLAANWLTDRYGMVPVGPGLTVTAGTYAAGLALLARDAVQDTLGRAWTRVGIALGAVATLAISPSLAIASAVAFLAAESADMAVYTRLRADGWTRAALASGTVGAIVDTAVFLRLAPFPFEWSAFFGQLIGKALWATALPVLAVLTARRLRRAVPRHPVRA